MSAGIENFPVDITPDIEKSYRGIRVFCRLLRQQLPVFRRQFVVKDKYVIKVVPGSVGKH